MIGAWWVLGLVGGFPVGWYFRFLLLLPRLCCWFWWLEICVVWVFYCFGWYGVDFRVLVVGWVGCYDGLVACGTWWCCFDVLSWFVYGVFWIYGLGVVLLFEMLSWVVLLLRCGFWVVFLYSVVYLVDCVWCLFEGLVWVVLLLCLFWVVDACGWDGVSGGD